MTAAFAALVPVFAVILIGVALRRSGFPGDGFWRPADRITYFVLFPALLVRRLAGAELGGLEAEAMAAALGGAILAMAAGLLAAERALRLPGPRFTSLFQGAVRQNTYVGLAAAGSLFGPAGQALAAVAVAVQVPLVNLLSAPVLARYGRDGGGRWRDALRPVLLNPLILACAAGLALNGAGARLPPVADSVLEILARAALPLGLLSVGAGLDLAAVRADHGTVAAATVLKLAVMPAIAWALLVAFGVEGVAVAVGVLFAAVPSSITAYVMARELGGDHGLMAAIIVAETALAVVTLPVALRLAG